MKLTTGFIAAGGILCAVLLAGSGCGGGGGTTAPGTTLVRSSITEAGGRAQITMRWPASSKTGGRLVPAASDSARVSFFDAQGKLLQTGLLVRPDANGGQVSINTFTDLPPGVLTVSATAFPNADGTGVAQANVVGQTTIVQNQLVTVTLTMNTTITRVEILPVNVQFTGNGTTTLNAAAYDADNNLVLTNSWNWQNSNPDVLNLVFNGAIADIQATGTGTTVVTATETESGAFATKTLQVSVSGPPPSP